MTFEGGIWKELREQTAAALILCTRNTELRTALYQELLQSNPACFPEHWIRLPVTLACTGADERLSKQTEKRITATLNKSLFTVSEYASFSITAVCTESSIRLSLIGQNGSIYFRYEYPVPVSDKHEAAACVNRFAERLFRVAVNRGTN